MLEKVARYSKIYTTTYRIIFVHYVLFYIFYKKISVSKSNFSIQLMNYLNVLKIKSNSPE